MQRDAWGQQHLDADQVVNETLGDSAAGESKMPSGSQVKQGPARPRDRDQKTESQMYNDLLKDASDLGGDSDLIPRDLTIRAWAEDQSIAFAKDNQNGGELSQENDRTSVQSVRVLKQKVISNKDELIQRLSNEIVQLAHDFADIHARTGGFKDFKDGEYEEYKKVLDKLAQLMESEDDDGIEGLKVEDFINANGRQLQEVDNDDLQLFEGLEEHQVYELKEIAEEYLDLFEETGGFKDYDDEQY